MRCLLALLLPFIMLSSVAGASPTIAISYFDNNTGQGSLDPLRKGLADMLITDLSQIQSIQIVEREKLNVLLGELKLGKGPFIDPRTAQKLGKGLSASHIMTGSYQSAEQRLRIDVRILDVATGKVAASEKVEGKKDEFFAMEKELVELLVKTLDLKLGLTEKSQLRRSQTESFEAFSRYSAGLDAKDRRDEEKAAALFRAALELDPQYQAARSALDRVKVLSRREDERHGGEFDALRKQLDPKAPDFGNRVYDLFNTVGSMNDSQAVNKRVLLLTQIAENDLKPLARFGTGKPVAPEAIWLLSLAMNYTQDPEVAEILPAVFEYVFVKYPDDESSRALRAQLPLLERNIAQIRQDRPAAVKTWALIEQGQQQLATSAGVVTERAAAHRLFRLIEKRMKKK